MSWDLLIAQYYAGLEVIAVIVAVVILISSLDDLFIDLWYWIRRLWRPMAAIRGLTSCLSGGWKRSRACRMSFRKWTDTPMPIF